MQQLHLVMVVLAALRLAELAVDESFKQDCLEIHNYYRNIHQVGNVTWSERMESFATNWSIYLAENNLFKHEGRRPGNMYLATSKPNKICSRAVSRMYTEEPLYNYSDPGYNAAAGHFTQIVWKKTKYIGADWRFRRDGKALLVIKYDPMGNWASAKAYRKNVFPPLYPTTENPLTTTAVAPMLNATNGSATNGSVTIPSTETRQKDEIFAGSTRAVSTALVLAGSLVAVLFAAEL